MIVFEENRVITGRAWIVVDLCSPGLVVISIGAPAVFAQQAAPPGPTLSVNWRRLVGMQKLNSIATRDYCETWSNGDCSGDPSDC